MASRLPSTLRTLTPLSSLLRSQTRHSLSSRLRSSPFSTSPRRFQDAVAPVKRPVGAFRGSLFGFLAGAVGAGITVYYYILEEYRVSNQLLTEDIFALQAAVQRIESYVRTLEEELNKKK